MANLPVDPVVAFNDLKQGKNPTECISCGALHRFRKKSTARRRYIQFLAMHLPEDEMVLELEDMV